MARTIARVRCPDCGDTFKVVLEPGEGLPKWCLCCGSYVGPDDPTKIGMPAITGIKAKVVDQTYRQIEESSEIRAELAGDKSLKVTNLRDNLREGDVAAMPVNNIVTQTAEAAKEIGFNYFAAAGQTDVAQAIQFSKQGQERTTGQRALGAIQSATSAGGLPKVADLKGFKPSWQR